jgi:hypothetical protein
MFRITKILRLQVPFVAGLIAVTSLSFVSAKAAGASGTSTFTTIDAPGAGTGALTGTIVTSINAAGDVTGTYIDSNGAEHGFVLPAGGAITIFNVTGAGTGKGQGTDAERINTSGVIAGTYVDIYQANHGFVRAADGTITTFDAPGAPTATKTRGTVVTNINDSGVIIGYYVTGISGSSSSTHSFMRAANGTITNIDDPNAVTTGIIANNGTVATSINDSGVIAGFYRDANLVSHGFVLSAGGTFTNFDPPGAGSCASNATGGTTVTGIDPAGDISGTYYDTNCAQHGYVRAASGAITTITISGAETISCPTKGTGNLICDTQPASIGPAGDITGGYVDSNSVVHGFLRAVDTGNITSFDDPNAGSGSIQGTEGFSINAAGTIAGVYEDSNSTIHGFIYTPALTATTTTLTPAPTPNPSVFGEPVTLSATVSSSAGTPQNGEIVNFLSGTTVLGNGPLMNGVATYGATALPVGTSSITAVYGGDTDFAGSTAGAVSQVVNKASSTTTLASSLNPSTAGQSVTLMATVSGQFSGTATGTVTFSYGSGTSLGSGTLSGGTASLATTALPTGTDSVIAVYAGDGNFTGSTSAAVSQVVNASVSPNPAPAVSGILPGFINAGSAAFVLTVNGSGFVASSTVYWGTTALATTYVSANQLSATVPATDTATGGVSAAITVVTPTPGGGTSNAFQFEVDSASGSTTGPTFTSSTATVTAGTTASYPVTLPSGVTGATVTCLNLPTGAACSYASNTLTITTTAATPAGTYQVTVVFTETVTGAATAWILLPILLLPLVFLRRRLATRGVWITACFGLILLAVGAVACIGCGGGGGNSTSTPQTHQATSSATVTLIVH